MTHPGGRHPTPYIIVMQIKGKLMADHILKRIVRDYAFNVESGDIIDIHLRKAEAEEKTSTGTKNSE